MIRSSVNAALLLTLSAVVISAPARAQTCMTLEEYWSAENNAFQAWDSFLYGEEQLKRIAVEDAYEQCINRPNAPSHMCVYDRIAAHSAIDEERMNLENAHLSAREARESAEAKVAAGEPLC